MINEWGFTLKPGVSVGAKGRGEILIGYPFAFTTVVVIPEVPFVDPAVDYYRAYMGEAGLHIVPPPSTA
jgi:hypothetical protein